jgi:hypothetical protein
VVDIHASYPYGHGALGVDGLTVSYAQFFTAVGIEQASAPLIPAIPEPSEAALLIAGLLGLVARSRLRV